MHAMATKVSVKLVDIFGKDTLTFFGVNVKGIF